MTTSRSHLTEVSPETIRTDTCTETNGTYTEKPKCKRCTGARLVVLHYHLSRGMDRSTILPTRRQSSEPRVIGVAEFSWTGATRGVPLAQGTFGHPYVASHYPHKATQIIEILSDATVAWRATCSWSMPAVNELHTRKPAISQGVSAGSTGEDRLCKASSCTHPGAL